MELVGRASGMGFRCNGRFGYLGEMLRYLRLSAAVLSLLACAFFVVLWMRSYRWYDDGYLHHSGKVGVSSMHGLLNVHFFRGGEPMRVGVSSMPVSELSSRWLTSLSIDATSYFRLPSVRRVNALKTTVVLPYWFLASVFGTLGLIFGLRRPFRFGLRQVLIVTALTALVLAMGVAARAYGHSVLRP